MKLTEYWSGETNKGETLSEIALKSRKGQNPCILQFGEGPQGTLCRDCAHMFSFRQSKTFWKCDLRKIPMAQEPTTAGRGRPARVTPRYRRKQSDR